VGSYLLKTGFRHETLNPETSVARINAERFKQTQLKYAKVIDFFLLWVGLKQNKTALRSASASAQSTSGRRSSLQPGGQAGGV